MDLHVEQPSRQEPIPPQEAEAIRRLLRRIGRRHPVRQVAEWFLEGGEVPPQTTELLLKFLKTPCPYHWRRQTIAAWMLGYAQWQNEDTEEAEKRLIKMVDIWALHNTGFRMLRTLGLGVALYVVFVLTTFTSMRHDTQSFVFFIVLLGGVFLSAFVAILFLPVLALIENGKLARIRAAAIVALGRLRSVEGLPALARACLNGSKSNSFTMLRTPRKLRVMALNAMEQILPCVTEYDYARLASGLPSLCKVLEILATKKSQEPQSSERVALLILSALGKVGDGRAAVIVERVAQKAGSESVRQAAWGVLPLLQDRRQQENAAHTLLRGAAPNREGQETLLRASVPTAQTDPTELLRPNTAQITPAILNSQQSEPQALKPQTSESETTAEFLRVMEPATPEPLVQQIAGQ